METAPSRAQALCIMCAETEPAERVQQIFGPDKIHEHGPRLF
jgi:hypothetical protein